jgi:hypothetical protein
MLLLSLLMDGAVLLLNAFALANGAMLCCMCGTHPRTRLELLLPCSGNCVLTGIPLTPRRVQRHLLGCIRPGPGQSVQQLQQQERQNSSPDATYELHIGLLLLNRLRLACYFIISYDIAIPLGSLR